MRLQSSCYGASPWLKSSISESAQCGDARGISDAVSCVVETQAPDLTDTDLRHLEEAEGWLGLGLWQEAWEEINQVSPANENRPEVLCCESRIFMKAEAWEYAVVAAYVLCRVAPLYPNGWIRLCYALHRSKRTSAARRVLMSVADRFPAEPIIWWHLALYSYELGDVKGARQWMKQAEARTRGRRLKQRVREEPELQPLWAGVKATGKAQA
jgi:predicted Zn-dependent protease